MNSNPFSITDPKIITRWVIPSFLGVFVLIAWWQAFTLLPDPLSWIARTALLIAPVGVTAFVGMVFWKIFPWDEGTPAVGRMFMAILASIFSSYLIAAIGVFSCPVLPPSLWRLAAVSLCCSFMAACLIGIFFSFTYRHYVPDAAWTEKRNLGWVTRGEMAESLGVEHPAQLEALFANLPSVTNSRDQALYPPMTFAELCDQPYCEQVADGVFGRNQRFIEAALLNEKFRAMILSRLMAT